MRDEFDDGICNCDWVMLFPEVVRDVNMAVIDGGTGNAFGGRPAYGRGGYEYDWGAGCEGGVEDASTWINPAAFGPNLSASDATGLGYKIDELKNV